MNKADNTLNERLGNVLMVAVILIVALGCVAAVINNPDDDEGLIPTLSKVTSQVSQGINDTGRVSLSPPDVQPLLLHESRKR